MRHTLALSLAILYMQAGAALAASWTDASAGLTGSIAGARSVVIDSTGTTLYVQTAANAVFKSADGGSSWHLLGNIGGVNVLALGPTSASTVYAGTANGVLKSSDGGESWDATGLTGTPTTILAVDPITPSTLYAAGSMGDQIYKSTDGGEIWNAYAVGLPSGRGLPPGVSAGISSLTLDPRTPSTIYVVPTGLGSNALYKSTDGGESWNAVNPGPFAYFLAIDPANSSTLYAIQRGFSRSTDGGATWAPIYVKDFDCNIQFPCRSVAALAIDPTNSNTWYVAASAPVGTPPAIYKSTDAGQNWNLLTMTIPFAQSVVLSPANPSIIYAVNYKGGVYKSTDAGATWSDSNNGLRVLGIHVLVADPSDPATIFAGGDEGLFQSVDGGASWSRQASFTAAGVPPPGLPPLPPGLAPATATASVQSLLIDSADSSILYAGTHRTDGCFFADILLFKTTDRGATWSSSITPDQSGCEADSLVAMDPADPNTLYMRWGDASYYGFSLRKSTDGGATWNYTSLTSSAPFTLVIDPTSRATLYAGTDNGVVRSPDGGANWLSTGLAKAAVNLLALDPVRPNVLYASTMSAYSASHGLLKSTDRGETWSPINAGLEGLLDVQARATALIVDPDHTDVLYLGTSGYGVFRSVDGGAAWTPFNDGLAHLDVTAMTIVPGASPAVYAATPGGVFKMVEDGKSAPY